MMLATQVLNDISFEDNSKEQGNGDVVGFIIIDKKKHEIRKGENKLGRDSSICSIVIGNNTVSKLHAVIESEGKDDTFIYDPGSTNQTKLGKTNLKPNIRYKIENGSIITLGNVVAQFVCECEKVSYQVKQQKSKSPKIDFDDLGDIFEVSTQVNAPQLDFFKQSSKAYQCVNTFKIPHFHSAVKQKQPYLEVSDNCFDEVTQCQLDDVPKLTIQRYDSIEDSSIFSLSTQCQLSQPSTTSVEYANINKTLKFDNTSDDADDVKSFLNDEEDDALCKFMSLHSPSAEASIKENEQTDSAKVELCTSSSIKIVPNEASIEKKTIQQKHFQNLSITNLSQDCTKVESLEKNKNFNLRVEKSVSSVNSENNFKNCVFVDGNFIQSQIKEDLDDTEEINGKNNENSVLDCNKINGALTILEEKIAIGDSNTESYFEITLEKEIKEKENINIFHKDFKLLEKTDKNKSLIQIKSCSQTKETAPLVKKSFMDHIDSSRIEEVSVLKGNSSEKNTSCLELAKEVSHVMQNFDSLNGNQICTSLKNFDQQSKTFTDTLENINLKEDINETSQLGYRKITNSDESKNTQNIPKNLLLENIEKKGNCEILCKRNSNSLAPIISTLKNSTSSGKEILNECSVKVTNCNDFSDTEEYFVEAVNYKNSCKNDKEKDTMPEVICKKTVQTNPNSFVVESSDDDTESDLDIVLNSPDMKKSESSSFSDKVEEIDILNKDNKKSIFVEQNSDSDSSYVFEVEEGSEIKHSSDSGNMIQVTQGVKQGTGSSPQLEDSDLTDCEDIEPDLTRILTEQEKEVDTQLNETQTENKLSILPFNSITTSDKANEEWMTGRESPKFEVVHDDEDLSSPLSQLSLEMPCTQEVEKVLKQNQDCLAVENKKDSLIKFKSQATKAEINNYNFQKPCSTIVSSENEGNENFTNSPVKRGRGGENITDVISIKRARTSDISHQLGNNNPKKLSQSWVTHNVVDTQSSQAKQFTNNKKTDIVLNISRKIEEAKCTFQSNKKIFDPQSKNTLIEQNPSCKVRTTRSLRSSKKSSNNVEPTNSLIDFSFRIKNNEEISYNLRSNPRKRNITEDFCFSKPVNVVFTGFECESLEKIITDLGGKKTCDLPLGNVVVSDKVRRTVKFLCAIGLGLPITSPEWLLASKEKNKFLNPWNYILREEQSEEKWNFSLQKSLEKSKKKKLLQGYSIFATENTKPPVKELLAIIQCCGGIPLYSHPDIWPKNAIVVSCQEDEKFWPVSKYRHVKIVHYECILSGVLRQKLDFKTYKLRRIKPG